MTNIVNKTSNISSLC